MVLVVLKPFYAGIFFVSLGDAGSALPMLSKWSCFDMQSRYIEYCVVEG